MHCMLISLEIYFLNIQYTLINNRWLLFLYSEKKIIKYFFLNNLKLIKRFFILLLSLIFYDEIFFENYFLPTNY